jgi:hypothetical protein
MTHKQHQRILNHGISQLTGIPQDCLALEPSPTSLYFIKRKWFGLRTVGKIAAHLGSNYVVPLEAVQHMERLGYQAVSKEKYDAAKM